MNAGRRPSTAGEAVCIEPGEPTRLIAIRHGETAWNAEARLQGQLDIPLNARGRAQAARLAQALAHERIAAVHASDLGRAMATAEALAQPLGLAVQPHAGLRERHFGELQGSTYEEVDARWPELARRWRTRDPEFTPPGGGESLRTFHARCVGTLRRLAEAAPGRTLVVVCHGGVLDCFYRAATGQTLEAPRTWTLGNAGINRLLCSSEGLSLIGWNDQNHLDGLELDELQG